MAADTDGMDGAKGNTMYKTSLLASADDVDGIEAAIREFWQSERYGVCRHTLRIEHPSKDMNKRFRVRRSGERFLFEHVES